MKPSISNLIITALLARGYSQLQPKEPLAVSSRKFKISPTHARRLDTPASIVEIGDGGAIRLGRIPMPRAMRQTLAEEGQNIYDAAAQIANITLEDLGL